MITIDDFTKVEIKIGTVLEAIKVPEADRLIKLIFDFGTYQSQPSVDPVHPFGELENVILNEMKDLDSSPSAQNDRDDIERLPELVEKYPGRDVRQIMSAIAPFYEDPSVLVGKQIAVCVNLEPRTFKGYDSQGMIMATDTEDGKISLLIPEKPVKAGATVH